MVLCVGFGTLLEERDDLRDAREKGGSSFAQNAGEHFGVLWPGVCNVHKSVVGEEIAGVSCGILWARTEDSRPAVGPVYHASGVVA